MTWSVPKSQKSTATMMKLKNVHICVCHTAFYNSKRYFTSSVRSSSAQQNDKKVPIFKDLTINRQCSIATAAVRSKRQLLPLWQSLLDPIAFIHTSYWLARVSWSNTMCVYGCVWSWLISLAESSCLIIVDTFAHIIKCMWLGWCLWESCYC